MNSETLHQIINMQNRIYWFLYGNPRQSDLHDSQYQRAATARCASAVRIQTPAELANKDGENNEAANDSTYL